MPAEDSLSVVDALARLSFVTIARMEARAAQAGSSIQQIRLLGVLRDREPTVNELTEHLGLDKSSVSGLVIRAERRGHVSRIPDDNDGRSVRVRLEQAGRAVIDAASAQFDRDAMRMFSTLSQAERERWVELTTRVIVADANQRVASR